MDRTPLQYLVSARDQSGYVSLGRTTTAAALKKARELLQEGYLDVNSQPARQQKLFSLYVQDDFRVSEKLKLNFGLRWDYLGPLTDRFDALSLQPLFERRL